jgi:hypothetical protein
VFDVCSTETNPCRHSPFTGIDISNTVLSFLPGENACSQFSFGTMTILNRISKHYVSIFLLPISGTYSPTHVLEAAHSYSLMLSAHSFFQTMLTTLYYLSLRLLKLFLLFKLYEYYNYFYQYLLIQHNSYCLKLLMTLTF